MRTREAKFYVQVERTNYCRNGESHNARAVNMTRERPTVVGAGCVVVALTVRIPD